MPLSSWVEVVVGVVLVAVGLVMAASRALPLDEAWFFAAPRDPRLVAAAFAVGLCFLGCSVGFSLWSLQLRRRVGPDR